MLEFLGGIIRRKFVKIVHRAFSAGHIMILFHLLEVLSAFHIDQVVNVATIPFNDYSFVEPRQKNTIMS